MNDSVLRIVRGNKRCLRLYQSSQACGLQLNTGSLRVGAFLELSDLGSDICLKLSDKCLYTQREELLWICIF